jgi:TPR repeat protein
MADAQFAVAKDESGERQRQLYIAAADQGHVEAMAMAGWLLTELEPVDFDRGEALLRKAMASGSVTGTVKLAEYLHRTNRSESVALWKAAARRGDANGMVGYARALLEGKWIRQDIVEGVHMMKLAAKMKSSRGCFGMSELHASGFGVPRDFAKAAEYLARIGETSDPGLRKDIDRLIGQYPELGAEVAKRRPQKKSEGAGESSKPVDVSGSVKSGGQPSRDAESGRK